MRTLVLVATSLGAILLFLLASASSNTTALFSRYYWQLFGLNALLTTLLFVTLIVQLYKLRQKVKDRVFGSRLTLRLTMTFALVAVLPGLLIYVLSVQFLTRSIDTWFDVRVDTALERGLNLGHSAIDYSLQDLERRGRMVAQEINLSGNDMSIFAKLAHLREQFNVQEMTLFTLEGKVVATLASDPHKSSPSYPSLTQLRQAEYKSFAALETDAQQKLLMRVIVPIHISTIGEPGKVLQLIQPVPEKLAADAEVVDQVRNDYKQLSSSRNGLKGIYSLTLTMALLMLMLGVFVLAIYLSDKLSAPLSLLAAGTRAVGQGDFSQQQPVVSRDELGILTHSFNRMTRQLADARVSLERNQAEQATAKAYLETILGNMTAGVLSFDEAWNLRSYNESAVYILRHDLETLTNTPLPQWEKVIPELSPLCHIIQQGFSDLEAQHWQRQIELNNTQHSRVLLVHCARLQKQHAEDMNSGYVMVFDDITRLIAAQRDAAWGEVARRLAHEIKNPLTPIQLAAERLEHKLKDKLSENDATFLTRGTTTIVNQVAALKNMVDAFKEYARQPSSKVQAVDFHTILKEVLVLYENIPLSVELADSEPMMIMGDATLLRQVIHNLLQNAQDAVAETAHPLITIKTKREKHAFILCVSDNGSGFPDTILPRIFEPYATSKAKGTGLGLAIIKKIVEEHHGRIHVGNQPQGGAFIRVDLPCWEEVREQ
jgi:nitrogen fixation/metabolism regulation signal transduction histidine kinase